MADSAQSNPYKAYWIAWAILLAITVTMLAAERLGMPRWFLILFLVAFMMVKATMIGGNFMHLRYEHRRMAFMVASGILLTSLILFFFISPESWHVRSLTSAPAPEPVGHVVE